MRRSSSGSIAVFSLFTAFLLFMFLLFIVDLGRAVYLSRKAQPVADAALLSSLRVRVEGLQASAKRASLVAALLESGNSDGGFSPATRWSELDQRSKDLRKSIPGYKGRITAVLKAVLGANGIRREAANLTETQASVLGIEATDEPIVDENGQQKIFRGVWLKRLWHTDERLAQPDETSAGGVSLSYPVLSDWARSGGIAGWIGEKQAKGRLRWDVRASEQAGIGGNGGFPRRWGDALDGTAVRPYRVPYFYAELTGYESK